MTLGQGKKEPMNNNRIKEIRLKQHKTQKDLAKLLNVSEQAIAYYEKAMREPTLSTWLKLANYFNVPMSYLTGVSDDETGWDDWENNTGYSKETILKEIDRLVKTKRISNDDNLHEKIKYAVSSLEQNIPTTTGAAIKGVQSRLIELRRYVNNAFLEKKYTPLTPGSKIGVIKPGDTEIRSDMDEEAYNKLIDIINNARWEIGKIHPKK